MLPVLLLIAVGFSAYNYRSSGGNWISTLAPELILGLAFADTPVFQKPWKALSLRWKISLVVLASALFLLTCFLVNLHNPNKKIDDLACAAFLASALFLWGLYGLMSRGLDALWLSFKHRK